MSPSVPQATDPTADPASLAAALGPVLSDACGGRLSKVTWFRTDWQRGGAATGRATYRGDDGETVDVMVKLPVVQRELLWTQRLQNADGDLFVPRLHAAGESLGGYDLAWLVIEWFPYGPLGTHWHDDHVKRVADAAARFYAAADAFPVDSPPRREPWDEMIRDVQESLRINDVPRRQAWRSAVKTLRSRLDRLVGEWEARDAGHWLHGDLHMANAMSRVSIESGPVVLIDLAEVHAGHWIEDAVFLERQMWARPERLKATRPVKAIATARKQHGLPIGQDYPRLAALRRALLAGTAPRFLSSEGDPRYLDACLGRLEAALTELK